MKNGSRAHRASIRGQDLGFGLGEAAEIPSPAPM